MKDDVVKVFKDVLLKKKGCRGNLLKWKTCFYCNGTVDQRVNLNQSTGQNRTFQSNYLYQNVPFESVFWSSLSIDIYFADVCG